MNQVTIPNKIKKAACESSLFSINILILQSTDFNVTIPNIISVIL